MIALIPVACVLIALILYFYISRWRAQRLRNKAFPESWRAILSQRMAVYPALSEQEQQRLHQLIKTFLDDKRFYGCAGLQITDEMRLVIAAEACLLLLNNDLAVYPKLSSVLVYPSAFQVQRDQQQADGTVAMGEHNLLGESWGNGRVILSWDDVVHGVADFTDGHNVVLHEFAHQLDAQSGSTNGAPPLRRNSYKSWAVVFSDNFESLQNLSMRQQQTVMDEYGATNPAEFFAVATETFFEKPHQLHAQRPQLYEELSKYYQLDPRRWH
tara:strand:+ start:57199 stop:58008 length:810 start_codon:yes stop_codon:yes gene_type:complete